MEDGVVERACFRRTWGWIFRLGMCSEKVAEADMRYGQLDG